VSAGELRIGDTEREGAVNALGEHYAAGRLSKEEYDERAAVAYAAKTESSLRPLFADLPGPHPFAVASSSAGGARSRPTGPGSWAGSPPFSAPGLTRGPQRGFRMPFLPFVLVLVGLAILVEAPWLLFIGLGVLLFARARRRGGQQSAHTSGWHGGCGTSRTR
jgi:hypothetical protein